MLGAEVEFVGRRAACSHPHTTDVDVRPCDTSWLLEPTTDVRQFGGGSLWLNCEFEKPYKHSTLDRSRDFTFLPRVDRLHGRDMGAHDMCRFRVILLFRSSLFAFLLFTSPHVALAQNRDTVIQLSLDTAMDMVQPEQMSNLAGHDDITLALHSDGSITEQQTSAAHQRGKGSTQRNIDSSGRLGGSMASSWHVKSSNVLERFRNFQQNTRTWRVTVAGSSCRLDVIDKLKPGFGTYSFPRTRDGTIAYFTNYRVTGTSCSIR
jgi:hypothetical protein